MTRLRHVLCCALLAIAGVLPVAAAEPQDETERCLELAGLVAEYCPGSCMRNHCSQRCVPPFTEDGRCLHCSENCTRICESQAALRAARCSPGAADGAAQR